MKKNKRSAFNATTVVLYIMLVATTLALVGVVIMYTRLATKDAAKKACEWDITKADLSKKIPDFSKLATTGHQQTSLTNCRRDELGDLVIRYKDIVEHGVINQNKAHKIIADEMAECWKMVGAGTKDPFVNWENDETSYCMICTSIKFDDKLRKYYQESKNDKEKAEKRGKNALIQSPIPYLKNEYKNGKGYFEYIYGVPYSTYAEKGALNYGSEQKGVEFEDTYLEEDTLIMLKLYKFEDKDWISVILSWGVLVAGVGLTILGGAITILSWGSLGWIGIPLMKVGISVSVLSGIGFAGVVVFDPVSLNPYSQCEECQAIGSLKLMPPQFDLATEVEIDYGEVKGQHVIEEGPYCSIIVN